MTWFEVLNCIFEQDISNRERERERHSAPFQTHKTPETPRDLFSQNLILIQINKALIERQIGTRVYTYPLINTV